MIKEIYKSGNGKAAICICDWCGEIFKRAYNKTKRHLKNYCNNKCKNLAHHKRVLVKCNYCGEEKETIPYKIKRNKHHFCNKKCGYKWMSENLIGKNHPNWKGGGITVNCSYCGETLKRPLTQIKRNKNNYCNQKCMGKWMSENIFGRNHPGWTGERKRITQGYIYIYSPNHPNATKRGYVMEHRLVMEKELGKFLLPHPYEIVHHKNNIKDDNRIENLKLIFLGEHNTQTQKIYQEMERLKKENQRLKKEIKKRKMGG